MQWKVKGKAEKRVTCSVGVRFNLHICTCTCVTDEAGTDEYMESEKHLAFEMRTLEISLNEEERKKSSEYEAEREKWHCEEMKKMEQKRQIERDFQKELKKIMEAEKVSQWPFFLFHVS